MELAFLVWWSLSLIIVLGYVRLGYWLLVKWNPTGIGKDCGRWSYDTGPCERENGHEGVHQKDATYWQEGTGNG